MGFVGALLLTITEIRRRESIDAESRTYFDYNPARAEGQTNKAVLWIKVTHQTRLSNLNKMEKRKYLSSRDRLGICHR